MTTLNLGGLLGSLLQELVVPNPILFQQLFFFFGPTMKGSPFICQGH